MSKIRIHRQILQLDGLSLLEKLPENASCEEREGSILLHIPATPQMLHWTDIHLGKLADADRIAALCQTPKGNLRIWSGNIANLPDHLIFFFALVLRTDGWILLLAPLPDNTAATRILSRADGSLLLRLDTGSPSCPTPPQASILVAAGTKAHRLCADAALSLSHIFPRLRLRNRKPLPAFARNLIWSSRESGNNAASLEQALDNYASRKIPTGTLAIDSLWEHTETILGERLLRSLSPSPTLFPDGFSPVCAKARALGFHSVLARQHLIGTPAGIAPIPLDTYKPRPTPPPLNPDFFQCDEPSAPSPQSVQLPTNAALRRFRSDAADVLLKNGIDAIALEGLDQIPELSASRGGIASFAQTLVGFAEEDLRHAFASNGMLNGLVPPLPYFCRHTSLATFPIDPSLPIGDRIRTRALASLWWGQFFCPAWEPLQTSAPNGEYAAAALAISGSPIGFADRPETASLPLLTQLAFPDGSVPLYPAPAFPAFPFQTPGPNDPSAAVPPKAFVLLNTIPPLQSGTAAVFDLRPDAPAFPNGGAQAFVSADDIPAANARRYAVWTHHGRELNLVDRRDSICIRTGTERFEVVTFAPILHDTYAILGIVSTFAAAATVLEIEEKNAGVSVQLAGPGEFAAAFMDRPSNLFCNGYEIPFSWMEESGLLLANLPNAAKPVVFIRF